jgi:hypothetical protein
MAGYLHFRLSQAAAAYSVAVKWRLKSARAPSSTPEEEPAMTITATDSTIVGNARKWGRSDARKRGHRFVVF